MAGILGPGTGIYPFRAVPDEPASGVIAFSIGDSRPPKPRRRLSRLLRLDRAKTVNPSDSRDSRPPPRTDVTVTIGPTFAKEDQARAWLDRTASGRAGRDEAVTEALYKVNRAMTAYRAASGDSYVPDISLDRITDAIVGYGVGEEILRGSWTAAERVPHRRTRTARRAELLFPQERMGGLLAGKETALLAEELTMRARTDVDCGRHREAAIQTETAVRALLREIGAFTRAEAPSSASERRLADGQATDIEWLAARLDLIARLAEDALDGRVRAADSNAIRDAVFRAERVLRRRRLLR